MTEGSDRRAFRPKAVQKDEVSGRRLSRGQAFVRMAGVQRLTHPLQTFIAKAKSPHHDGQLLLQDFFTHMAAARPGRLAPGVVCVAGAVVAGAGGTGTPLFLETRVAARAFLATCLGACPPVRYPTLGIHTGIACARERSFFGLAMSQSD